MYMIALEVPIVGSVSELHVELVGNVVEAVVIGTM